MKTLMITISEKKLDGRNILIELRARVTQQEGSDEEVAATLLEAEMRGNSGKARVHIFVKE